MARSPEISVESSVTSQFARVFLSADSQLFKKLGESNLREAAYLKMEDMEVEDDIRLLARNARKRLLIGVGVELVLKSLYLQEGVLINKTRQDSRLRFPTRLSNESILEAVPSQTVGLNELIQRLPSVVRFQEWGIVERGLRIAKVFRNKEGHTVTSTHVFEPSNYQDIAAALVCLYGDAFEESLDVQFSMAPNEPARWLLTKDTGERHR